MALTDSEKETLKAAAAIIQREALASPTTGETTRLSVHGFGVFKFGMSKARDGRNPKTGATVPILSHRTVKFTVSKSWLTE